MHSGTRVTNQESPKASYVTGCRHQLGKITLTLCSAGCRINIQRSLECTDRVFQREIFKNINIDQQLQHCTERSTTSDYRATVPFQLNCCKAKKSTWLYRVSRRPGNMQLRVMHSALLLVDRLRWCTVVKLQQGDMVLESPRLVQKTVWRLWRSREVEIDILLVLIYMTDFLFWLEENENDSSSWLKQLYC